MADDARTHPHIPGPPQLVDTPAVLRTVADRLLEQPRVAVDTESNSLHAYRERTCLLQFSVPAADFVVDPLAIPDLDPLKAVFETPAIEKVFHAADYDLMVLLRDFGFRCVNLFDTMWAARVLGWPKVGLGDVMGTHLGVAMDKHYQRYDWGTRPLNPDALRYAQLDSHYLLALRDLQATALQATGRWAEAQEIFAYLTESVTVSDVDDSAHHFWRIKGVHDLRPYEQRLLYQLFLWRESEACRVDRPPVKVISNEKMVVIARVQPRTLQELADAGLTQHQVRRFGNAILKALHSHPHIDPPDIPDANHVHPDVVVLYKELKAWRREVADARGVDPDVILPNASLWQLARRRPCIIDDLISIPGIGPWRQVTYGPALLQILRCR